MSKYLKCECSHCGQSIEFPSEGVGMVVPCPTCEKRFTLKPLKPEVDPDQIASPCSQREHEASAKKTSRPDLTKLTPATIRAKTESGDTPLHRAAENGEFELIPDHLLSADLFLEKNDAGETPLHVAAKHGHLDQVPTQFLTKETLTCRVSSMDGPNGTVFIYADKLPQTGTVLHIAARFGHADQIPKEFLAPEFLCLAAGGNESTLLEIIAQADQLHVIPDLNANVEVRNSKNGRGQTPENILGEQKQRGASVARVGGDPATEKQKAKLRWFKYPVKQGMTKTEANDALTECAQQFPEQEEEYYNRPATKAQLATLSRFLAKDGEHPDDYAEGDFLTYGEAKDLLLDCERAARR